MAKEVPKVDSSTSPGHATETVVTRPIPSNADMPVPISRHGDDNLISRLSATGDDVQQQIAEGMTPEEASKLARNEVRGTVQTYVKDKVVSKLPVSDATKHILNNVRLNVKLQSQDEGGIHPEVRVGFVKHFSADDYLDLQTGDVKFTAEVADTPELRRKGLSRRAALADNHGMLFDTAGSFWMRGVKFPLDIAFLGKQGEILEIQHMPVIGDSGVKFYSPASNSAVCALEMPGGWFKANGVKPGHKINPV